MREATERAIALLGGTRPAARVLKVTPGTVNYWKQRGRVPAEDGQVLRLEAAVRCQVTRYELRPDVYGEA